MKRVEKVKVSQKGFTTTIYFEDGSRRTVNFRSFEETYHNFSKALSEYIAYISTLIPDRQVSQKVVEEIKTKIRR